MKFKIRLISFALTLLPAFAFADSVSITFDTALTNETEWVYETIKSGNEGYYINNKGATVTSPDYNFCITSITIHVSTSRSCTRNLIISPIKDGAAAASLAREFTSIPQGSESDVTACWDIADNVSALKIESTSGANNLYLLSATIYGVPHVDAPTEISIQDVSATRFTVSWIHQASAAATSAVYVSKITSHPASGEVEKEYTFAQFSNTDGNSKESTSVLTNEIPEFAGSSLIYLPAKSSNFIQISNYDRKGYLVHSGFNDCSDLSIVISAKIPTNDHGKTLGIGYESSPGTTNVFSSLNMTVNYATNIVSMSEVPDDTAIIFNTEGSKSDRVVHIDYLSFVRNYIPAYVETNAVSKILATESIATIKGLEPDSHYVVYVTAFDGEGNESPPSEFIEVWTNDKNVPFSVNIR